MKKYKKYPVLRKKILLLHTHTVSPLIAKIKVIEQTLIKRAGGGISIKNHSLITPMQKVEVTQCMIKEKNAYKLEEWLNDYVTFLNTKYKKFGIPKLPIIARTNHKNALYMNDITMRQKDFAHAYFENTPVILAVIYLKHFRNTILRYEEEVIKYMILSLVDKK
ncbi:hypothetical protein M23134_06715 [Microscilla marina ATCC 23134]|uniref:Gliding motility-associated protein GldM N-terminal domain-containing protein n=1 Tax=Microscilla marina ATCC 23134 TaxID=313606 RepID=A1ZXP5_MICM2|nr:hypothetical protein M23134_06715 [Microscilla marina ATCC 23134]